MPAEIRPVRCLPKVNSSAAPNISQGSTRKKVCAGVLISSTAPANPPTILITISGIITRREMFKCLRYAPPLAVTPTHRASVLVAFAATGATPVNNNAGKAMKLPPPATALSAPPNAPAANKKMACGRVKLVLYHECAGALHLAVDWRVEAASTFLTSCDSPYMNVRIHHLSTPETWSGCRALTWHSHSGCKWQLRFASHPLEIQ